MARSTDGHSSAARRPRSRHSGSSKRHHVKDELEKPDLEELRRLRESHYARSSKGKARASYSPSVRAPNSTSVTERSGDKRKSRSYSSGHPKTKTKSKPLTRTEAYVYGTAAPIEVIVEENEDEEHVQEWSEEKRRHKRSLRESTSSILDLEVTPDDSVSQIGMRRHRRPKRIGLPPVLEGRDENDRMSTAHSSTKRNSVSLGSIFRRSSISTAPPKLVECLTCCDEMVSSKTAKLECGHRMCHACLKRIFRLAVKDPAHMPPKCCTDQHIPLRYVDRLFDLEFKMRFHKKYEEYKAKDRVYCPNSRCGLWIRPAYFRTSGGRRIAQCNRCFTKACIQCGLKLHKSKDCPKDPEMVKLVEQAEREGWKRCYSCNAMVELKEGCNHMTCRCTAEFCMVCGAKWKTCDCPWFNAAQIADADRLLNMRIPDFQVLFDHAIGVAGPARAPARTYREEMAQRRRQENDDENLAQRMQWATLLDDDRPRAHFNDAWGVGNAAGHHLNDDHVLQDTNVRMDGFGDEAMGKRGERASGRRRAARHAARADTGLIPNFLGEPSVLHGAH